MFEIRKILVAVDCSTCSRTALEHALALAAKHQASVDILHVAEVPQWKPEPRVTSAEGELSVNDYAVKTARREVETFLRAVPGAPNFELEVAAGQPREVILDRAQRGAHDLIVMGTQGRTGRVRSLAGSVAESVVRGAPCPVLTVRERA
jgi:universal stress protein A